ncbi:hypothetical protein C1J03_08755 [Sulfitobacter sp. SK012]|nr:hypothetical protein C1J03_08755 [Sulfitobacter sp. SK012]
MGCPIKGFFEGALWQPGANKYDKVWSASSLDHSNDPVLGLFNLISICRIGGGAIMMLRPNDAEGEDYKGLHQWNLDNIFDGELILHQLGRRFSMMPLLRPQGDLVVQNVAASERDKAKLIVKFKKRRMPIFLRL